MSQYQPRYRAYCKANGRDPEAQMAHDDEEWPGGCMAGYILWIRERWAEWGTLANWPANLVKGPQQHAAFDEWLNSILSSPTSQQWPLELTQGEAAIHHPAPESKGEIAA